MKTYNLAVLGATGAVGRTILSILAQRQFPLGQLHCLASERSAGKKLEYNGQIITVKDAAQFDFSQVQLALFSAGGAISAVYAPRAAQAGCIVIDNTSHFRYDIDIPLVIPEVNPEALSAYKQRNIIANPNCSTIQMMMALKPLHDKAVIKRINVATYQAVSGSGQQGIDELCQQTQQVLAQQKIQANVYPTAIAFNVIPQIDIFQENGYSKEEMKMVWETQKILADDSIAINPTAVRVPVLYGHSEAVHIETAHKLTAQQARDCLQQAPGITVMDDPTQCLYPTPRMDAEGSDRVYVGRVREDISHTHGLNLWIVSDNVRKGAALNAVQIAEILIRDYL